MNPNYEVRPDVTIWTCISTNGMGLIPDDKWRQITNIDSGNYIRVIIRWRGRKKFLKAHRIVYAKFIGALDHNLDINHKNGIRTDNRPVNLELETPEGNNAHKYRELGAKTITNSKLTYQIAEEIRKIRKETGLSYSKIGAMFDISKGHVSDIVNNRIWNIDVKQYSEADLEDLK